MVQLMTPQLKAWDESDQTKVILLMPAEGSRAFCAGGDVKDIVERVRTRKPEEVARALKFFEEEYKLNHLIGTLKKPFISLMNGITMGGGVGLSVHAPFRIVTENTVFAMPETNIGLFPDVGGSFFLPRLDGELGTYLGLTGHRLKGQEVWLAGIGTHYVPSDRVPNLINRLSDIETDELEVVNMAIEEFCDETAAGGAGKGSAWDQWSLGGDVAGAINRCFRHDTIEEIVSALEREGTSWSKATLSTLKSMSPTSLKVTLRQLRKGRSSHFAQCFQMEYAMVQQFLRTRDFTEGVTATLTERRKPTWSPTWDEMMAGEVLKKEDLDAYFPATPAPTAEKAIHVTPPATVATVAASGPIVPTLLMPEITPPLDVPGAGTNARVPRPGLHFLKDATFREYPHRTLSGLPTDRDVEKVKKGEIRRGSTVAPPSDKEEVVQIFLHNWGGYDRMLQGPIDAAWKLPDTITIENGFGRGKTGLREKVESILARK
ncbi:hypothetical protein HK101_010444 [Irineochytrium annulatum]|nr:hypothetical protein HK101_010444 [Irineochytrium annulatum]